MTTQPLTRYGARDGALASGLITTCYTTSRDTTVSPFRRGQDLKCIYLDERPDLSRELPNWMFDDSYCEGMMLGPPEISIEDLNDLAAVLASFGKAQKRGAQSRPSNKKEKGGAEKPV